MAKSLCPRTWVPRVRGYLGRDSIFFGLAAEGTSLSKAVHLPIAATRNRSTKRFREGRHEFQER